MITKRPISYWIKTSNMKLQGILVVVIVVTVFTRVLPLEMQKKIINEAIGLGKLNLLYMYCAYYFAAVVLASGLKYVINILQTYIGQQALARLRKELYAHILKLPLSYFRKANPGMVVSSLVSEIAPTGELVGQSVAVPVTNLLTLIAFAGYMFYLNPLLAGLSIAIYPIIIFLVPMLQKRTNKANKERVDTTRTLSSKINESISGIHEIQGNCSHKLETDKYDSYVERLFRIRIVWILFKHGTKVLNNFFQNLGPFILFIVGGYLAINGRFDLGALVAFLSANEKIYDPWKELMDFYQVYQDSTVRYARVMEYFDVEPEFAIEPKGRGTKELDCNVEVKNLSFTVEGGIQLLKRINMDLKDKEQLALVGFSGSGKSTLAQCISQLYKYTGGSVQIGGEEVENLTKMDMAANIGIVAQAPFIFDGSIKDNLLYGCKAIQSHLPEDDQVLPSRDDMIAVIQQTGIFVDVLRFGLNTILVEDNDNGLKERIFRVRQSFQAEYGDELADLVEFYDSGAYLYHSTVAENLIFGHPAKKEYNTDNLSENKYFLDFLNEAQLTNPFLNLGREITTVTVDILGDLEPDEVFFRQSPIPVDEFEEYKELVRRIKDKHISDMSKDDKKMLLNLTLSFVPGKHKIVAMPEVIKSQILEARVLFSQKIEEDDPGAVSFFKIDQYITSQTILENILFGKPRSDMPNAQEKISQSIIQLLIQEDLLETIVELGMEFQVGTKGDRLSGGQRQKLAIARAFLKNPPMLIMDEATSALDNASQKRIQTLLETRWKGKATVIAVIHRLDTIKNYDQVAVMKAGKVMEMGPYQELMDKKGLLYELVHGAK